MSQKKAKETRKLEAMQRRVQNLEQQGKGEQRTVTVRAEKWEGILPQAKDLKEYEVLGPEVPQKIVSWADAIIKHGHSMDREFARSVRRTQWFRFAQNMTMIAAAAAIFIWGGSEWAKAFGAALTTILVWRIGGFKKPADSKE